MSETLNTAFETLERKIIALGEEKNRLATALQESKERFVSLEGEFSVYRQTSEQENARLAADNALLSEKLNKLLSRVESMKQNM